MSTSPTGKNQAISSDFKEMMQTPDLLELKKQNTIFLLKMEKKALKKKIKEKKQVQKQIREQLKLDKLNTQIKIQNINNILGQ